MAEETKGVVHSFSLRRTWKAGASRATEEKEVLGKGGSS